MIAYGIAGVALAGLFASSAALEVRVACYFPPHFCCLCDCLVVPVSTFACAFGTLECQLPAYHGLIPAGFWLQLLLYWPYYCSDTLY